MPKSHFLPPVAVFLARGWGTDCIVDIILTILAWFPGMLYA
ncbi:YqaE/Pmp3 family membrane protein, partial [Erysipelatoclostridium ramosum]|nr:YqaE/Pmp3 family membrane protein [Thomasclavelia ramosa]